MAWRPAPGWAFCKLVKAKNSTESGLFYGEARAKVGEALAEVISITPKVAESGKEVPLEVAPGDIVIFREFLRYVDLIGQFSGVTEELSDAFLLNIDDMLAVVPRGSSVTVGVLQEFTV